MFRRLFGGRDTKQTPVPQVDNIIKHENERDDLTTAHIVELYKKYGREGECKLRNEPGNLGYIGLIFNADGVPIYESVQYVLFRYKVATRMPLKISIKDINDITHLD